ncbi:MAG: DEAD/DEAH box helicase family protein [Flavobacteriales bacterium]|nr:DEAD/DEAH box helicase family protein [Flavobacteriales bacterium]
MNKKSLSERDICTKFITPAILAAGWDVDTQFREEVSFTDGRIYVRGKLTARGKRKRADYILYYKPNIPIAIIEAKDNNHSLRAGMQQALDYAATLDIPCVFSSNGDGFVFHDRTLTDGAIEQELGLEQFPRPEVLWERYKKYKGIKTEAQETVAAQDYYLDGSGRSPRYYQQVAINRTVEAVAKGQDRILLTMATGTGKTYTAFQIVHRLWKAGVKKRILFLADRTALIDQTKRGDFKHFRDSMTVVKHRMVDKSYEIYLALYQGLTGNEESKNIYKQFSPEFFDLIVVDECHRGSAADDSAWREILTYFKSATHIGLTATPRETETISNTEYFGEPIYTYSLKQGIDDGFLAPYRVVRVGLNVDLEGWRPDTDKTDTKGDVVEDRIYNTRDFDRNLVIEERTRTVARKVTEFLKGYDRFAKTIVFCVDIDHAERMRQELANCNADLVKVNPKYVMQITGDNDEGKRELDNFIDPQETYPVIATTSELMTTGVDAQTCKVIVLDAHITSMTKFKQIIGRGTRINEDYGKLYFTILDFRNATDLFADPGFDGDPIRIKSVGPGDDLGGIVGEEEADPTPITGEDGTEVIIDPPPSYPGGLNGTPGIVADPPGRREKVVVNGVDVSVLVSRDLYFDRDGKPITTSLKDHARGIIQEKFASMDDFLNQWNQAERKEALIKELEEQGVLVEALQQAVNREVDLFDLICHVAYDQPPLTRRERANNVKKRNYFTKYGTQARAVLEALLEKYADEGLENLESPEVLRVVPFSDMGGPLELMKRFGSPADYNKAITELENELYRSA